MSKILKITTFILMITYGKTLLSQPYQKMLGETNEWNIFSQLIEGGFTCLWQTTTDTTIESNIYKKVELSPASVGGICSGIEGFIREDTASKKIYYRNCNSWGCDTLELLLYDFSKLPGDTVTVNELYNFLPVSYLTQSLILDSVTTDTLLSLNRIYHLHSISGIASNPKWIEGVGSLTGLENNLTEGQSGVANYLLCAFKDSVQTFQISSSFFPFSPTCDLFVAVEEIREQSPLSVTIFPNPAKESLNVSSTKEFAILNISLMTLSGKILIQTIQPQIPVSHLSEGLYFVRVEFTNGQQAVRKIVIQ